MGPRRPSVFRTPPGGVSPAGSGVVTPPGPTSARAERVAGGKSAGRLVRGSTVFPSVDEPVQILSIKQDPSKLAVIRQKNADAGEHASGLEVAYRPRRNPEVGRGLFEIQKPWGQRNGLRSLYPSINKYR